MKLWLLRPHAHIAVRGYKNSPWDPWYDKCFGLVIRAETEDAARQLAFASEFDEGWGKRAWLDKEQSICEELLPEGEPEIIIEDTHYA